MSKQKLNHILQEIEKLHPKRIDLSLGRMVVLLEKLGNPHHNLPPIIHIGGTNGKGSTLSFLRYLLQEHGMQVNAYTSPHLVHFHERIILRNQYIDDEYLYDILQHIMRKNNGDAITFFEMTTIAAFMAFAQQKSDILLLEVGLGGRVDSTNIIPKKDIAMITPIGKDHMDFLGNSFAKIATQKAGIIPNSKEVIIAKQRQDVSRVLKTTAYEHNVPLSQEGAAFFTKKAGKYWSWHNGNVAYKLPYPALKGHFQLQNASMALAALHKIAPTIELSPNISAIEQAMGAVSWPARLQYIANHQWVRQYAPNIKDIWLDGCHNAHGAKQIARFIKENKYQNITIILSLMANRPLHDFIQFFTQFNIYVIACDMPACHDGHAKEYISQTVTQEYNIEACNAPSIEAALTIANNKNNSIFILGSLYQAGYVLERSAFE